LTINWQDDNVKSTYAEHQNR